MQSNKRQKRSDISLYIKTKYRLHMLSDYLRNLTEKTLHGYIVHDSRLYLKMDPFPLLAKICSTLGAPAIFHS